MQREPIYQSACREPDAMREQFEYLMEHHEEAVTNPASCCLGRGLICGDCARFERLARHLLAPFERQVRTKARGAGA
ncbi:MAG TPA: hypothetical protein VN776_16375 [Terracidiphilus sp.]|nr:hypothetical protein [Terracidiphilus sp.]